MSESYPFATYSGLLEPKHYKRINKALWFFLWCISSTTKEKMDDDGVTWGLVLGGKPMKLSDLADPFEVNDKTVSRWIDILEEHHYIQVIRAPYGLIIEVRNSKKYKNRSDNNVLSEVREQTKLSDHSTIDQTEMSDHTDRNVRSNKDIIKTLSSSSDSEQHQIIDELEFKRRAKEVEDYFIIKRNSGFDINYDDEKAIRQAIADGIPVETIKSGIDKSFEKYTPKHRLDRIRTFTYCAPAIYDAWVKEKAITEPLEPVALGSITENVPSEPVALGKTSYRSKQQKELDELDRLIAEEERKLGTSRSS
ncbi:hypothetical protein E0485_15045 [Paenibacillus albiflavus]|uniref:Uncharacterized protein n=1 Tax=Paenibacillus albiflavus TaxID=2545760 RepID=A0A4R4EAM8_9BACL|nr:hypothetical protein [Paenibacillus albiflavus]TCZ76153.1 hypothetical protein E0485_15045 [Paenibacillus albiflavus]